MRRSELSSSLQALIDAHCTQQGMYKISVFDTKDPTLIDENHLVGWLLCTVSPQRLARHKGTSEGFDQEHTVILPLECSHVSYLAKVQPMGAF